MERVTVRPASLDDAAAICTIYNQGIEDRVATLETELRDMDERRRWLAARGARYPVVVAKSRLETVGWASLNVFNARDAYRFVADISVYVERGWRGKGVGRIMLEKLVELGRTHGYHKLVRPRAGRGDSDLALPGRRPLKAAGGRRPGVIPV